MGAGGVTDSYADPYDDRYNGSTYRRPRRHSTSVPMVLQQPEPVGVAGSGVGGFNAPPSPYMRASPMPIPGRPASDGAGFGVGSSYPGGLGTTPPFAPSSMPISSYPNRELDASPYGVGAGYPPAAPPYGAPASVGPGVPMGAQGYPSSAGFPGGPGAGMGVQSYPSNAGYPGGMGAGMGAGLGGGYAGSYGAGGLSRSHSGTGLAGATYGTGPVQYAGTGYAGAGYPVAQPPGYPTASNTYPFPSGGGGGGTIGIQYDGRIIPAQPGSTIIIKSRPRRHSSRHHRSRSRDGYRDRRDSYDRY